MKWTTIQMDYRIKTTVGASHVDVLNVCKDLSSFVPRGDEPIIFDFNGYAENNPFCNLVLINALRRIRFENPDIKMSVQPNSNTYLSYVGFYKAIGIDYGNSPGRAPGSSTYVPITEIDTSVPSFYIELARIVKRLAATLNYEPALEYMLKYVFQESIRNVYEHAMTNKVLVAAQKWPSKNLLEIAIADAGCGILGSLGKRFDKEPLELLRLACQPGITAQSNACYTGSHDALRNSGYGLYVMKELTLRCKGRFMICSGNHAIAYSYTNNGIKEAVYTTSYEGLALCLQFRTDERINFYGEIPSIASQGEEIASGITGAVTESSKSSQSVI